MRRTKQEPPAGPTEASQRAFRFLQELASDLSKGGITFPTFIDATLRVRNALADPNIAVERLAQIVSGEPMLATKLVRMANSVALNPGGRPVQDVRTAVLRVGFETIRATAAAVAMQQVRQAKDLARFADEAERVWRHSLEVAAIAYVLAKGLSRISPDEALFAGLVHDIGRFYLLSRASRYPELVGHEDELAAIIDEWHPSIGEAVLQRLRLPQELTAAISGHELGQYDFPPKSLLDVVTLANLATRSGEPEVDGSAAPRLPEDSPVFPVLAGAADEVRSLVEALG